MRWNRRQIVTRSSYRQVGRIDRTTFGASCNRRRQILQVLKCCCFVLVLLCRVCSTTGINSSHKAPRQAHGQVLFELRLFGPARDVGLEYLCCAILPFRAGCAAAKGVTPSLPCLLGLGILDARLLQEAHCTPRPKRTQMERVGKSRKWCLRHGCFLDG